MTARNCQSNSSALRVLPALALALGLSACESTYGIQLLATPEGHGAGDLGQPISNGGKPVGVSIGRPSPRPTASAGDKASDDEDAYSDPKLVCERLARMPDAPVMFADKPVDSQLSTDLLLEERNGKVSVTAEKILAISNISGNLDVVARGIGPVRKVNGQYSINAVQIESIAGITGNGTIVAERVGTSAETVGNLKLSVGSIDIIQGTHGFSAVLARKIAANKQNQIQLIEGTDGTVLVCGMSIRSLRNTHGSVLVVGGDIEEVSEVHGKVIVVGGKVVRSSNIHGKLETRP